MDPNAALRDLKAAKADGDNRKAKQIRRDLRDWVSNGGFEPSDPSWRDA